MMFAPFALATALAPAPSIDQVVRDHMLFSLAGKFVPVRGAPTPEEIVGKIRFSHAKTVVIVIHGGLVSTRSALETYRSLHLHLADSAYPVYLSWESGPAFAMFPPQRTFRNPKGEPIWLEENIRPPHPLGDAERRLEHNTRGAGLAIWRQIKRFAAYGTDTANPDAVMGRFMRALIPLWRERNLRIVFVGHSAGAHYIARTIEGLRDWGAKAQQKSEVVFLAPAAPYAFLARRLPSFRTHVRAFRLFGLEDGLERQDALLAVKQTPRQLHGWYEASLLYYISNNLEGQVDRPILGLERFLRLAQRKPIVMPRDLDPQELNEIKLVDDFLHLERNSVWSLGPTLPAKSPHHGEPGWDCGATRHLEFWSDPRLRESLRHIVANPMAPL